MIALNDLSDLVATIEHSVAERRNANPLLVLSIGHIYKMPGVPRAVAFSAQTSPPRPPHGR